MIRNTSAWTFFLVIIVDALFNQCSMYTRIFFYILLIHLVKENRASVTSGPPLYRFGPIPVQRAPVIIWLYIAFTFHLPYFPIRIFNQICATYLFMIQMYCNSSYFSPLSLSPSPFNFLPSLSQIGTNPLHLLLSEILFKLSSLFGGRENTVTFGGRGSG